METSEALAEFWTTVREYIPNKDKGFAAHHVVTHLVDLGLPDKEFYALAELDQYMSEAIKEALEEFNDDYEDFEEDY